MHNIFRLILIWFLPLSALGQTDSLASVSSPEMAPVPLNFERTLEDLKEDPELDYKEHMEQENAWTRFKKNLATHWKRLIERIFGTEKASGFLLWILESLPYLILLVVLGLVVYLFVKMDPGSAFLTPKRSEEAGLSLEEDIVRYEDIPSLVQNSVSQGDYRLAVRYHFLYILQQLSRKNVILYDKTKTDEDYLMEIKEAHLRERFEKVSQIYDFIWYGYFETGEASYHTVASKFRELEALIEGRHE